MTDEETESQLNYSKSCLSYSKLHLEKAIMKNMYTLKSRPMQTNHMRD